MSEQVLIQFRADKDLKKEVTEIYEAIGMDLPTAFRMFMIRSKTVRGLPFPAVLDNLSITHTDALRAFDSLRAQAKNIPEMTAAEIDAEIKAARNGD